MFTSIISVYLATLLKSMPDVSTRRIEPAAFADVLSAYPIPEREKTAETNLSETPNIQANAYLAMDMRSGKMLTEKNIHERRSVGSITKLMTALLILDENNINDVIKIPQSVTAVEGTRIWLAAGEKITIKDLLYGTLIHSGNDAAYALAVYNAGSVENFVTKMNEKAGKLGLKNTNFGNPAGLDRDNNYSTAYDVALLGTYAYRNSFIRHAVAMSKLTVMSTSGQFKHELKSTNLLLEKDPRVKGLKTGYTLEAGKSFVGVSILTNSSPLLTVVLDSPDRFKETVSLIDWSSTNFTW